MQDRRDAHGLADLRQTRAAVLGGRFRGEQAVFPRRHGGAARGQDDDVIFQQFLHQSQVGTVLGGAAVVAAHHAGDTPDAAVDDVVVQGVIRAPDGAAQQVPDGLVAEAHHGGGADALGIITGALRLG